MKKLLLLILTLQVTLFATGFQDGQYVQITENESIDGHVDHLEKKYYHIKLSNKEHTVTVKLTGLDADIDMYLGIDNKPRIRSNDCYSSNGKTKDEECIISIPSTKNESTSLIIMVYGFKTSDYKLEVSTKDGLEKIQEISYATYSYYVEKGESDNYKFFAKKGETYITKITGLSADVDLRVKIGKKANKHTFDCKSTNGGTKTDQCSVTLKEDSWVYVNVDGYRTARYLLNTDLDEQNTNKKLLNETLNQCLTIKKDTSDIFCMNDENMAYFLYNRQYNEDHYVKLYRVDTALKTIEFVQKIKVENPPTNFAFFIDKLENTNLIGVKTTIGNELARDYYTFYNNKTFKKVSTLDFSDMREHDDDYKFLLSMKTINNGQQLEVKYEYSDYSYTGDITKHKSIYNIEQNPDKITFVSDTLEQ